MTADTPFDLHVQKTMSWLSTTVRAMVDQPQRVQVEGYVYDDHVRLDVHVHDDDVGQVVGRAGHNAQGLRTILLAIGRCRGIRYRLNIQV